MTTLYGVGTEPLAEALWLHLVLSHYTQEPTLAGSPKTVSGKFSPRVIQEVDNFSPDAPVVRTVGIGTSDENVTTPTGKINSRTTDRLHNESLLYYI